MLAKEFTESVQLSHLVFSPCYNNDRNVVFIIWMCAEMYTRLAVSCDGISPKGTCAEKGALGEGLL